MRVIDLFCGAGGFSKGFERGGYSIVLGIDKWKTACDNFKLNHPSADVWNRDVSSVDVAELPKDCIIIGGTPCQEFTSLNLKKQPWRGMLNVCHFLRIVYKYKPQYWIMENVIGLNKYLPAHLFRVKLKANYYGCESGRRRLFVGNFPVPNPVDINFNPQKTLVAVDNRNKNKGNVITNDLNDLIFKGNDKEIKQLQANCVIPKLAYEIAKKIKEI